MSRTPHIDTSASNAFKYASLDPHTPVQIEEYSDLYDDYMNSPQSQNLQDSQYSLNSNDDTTMNPGAAVYEQSVAPSKHQFSGDSINNSSIRGSQSPLILNNRNQPDVLDDSLDSSFVSNSELSSKTPQLNYNTQFVSPRTPNGFTPSSFNKLSKTPNQQQQNSINQKLQNLDISKNPNPLGIYGVNSVYSPTSQYYQQFESPNDSRLSDNDNGESYGTGEQVVDNEEDDDDEDYDDSEVEQLLLQARLKNLQLYSTCGQNMPTNSNDATIINNSSDSGVPKIIRKSIKDFKLGKELGEGSYSTVMLGTDITNGKKYAMKILNKRHIIKEKKVKYVNIEKNALNRLGDRNGIIGLHFTFQDSQSLYFVLDFAENGELLTLIKKFGTMNDTCTKYYTVQLIDAIDYMHKNGVIHRDLKPENILIDKDLKLQITDFGTAKLLDKDDLGNYPSDARANSFVGTAEYVSPELLNDKYCGKAADVWSLGCIIYQMIAGKPPFKATNEYLTFQKIQKLQYAFTAGFPIIIRDLIKRILLLKPRERLTVNDIKKHMWFKNIIWDDQDQIWNHPPPELGPYKISAKAMKPIPELDNQYPNGSSTSILQMKKSKSTNVLSSSGSNGINGNKKSNTNPVKKRAISTNSAPSSASNPIPSTPPPLSAPNSAPPRNTSSTKIKSASSAASAALYGNSRKPSSSTTNNPSSLLSPPPIQIIPQHRSTSPSPSLLKQQQIQASTSLYPTSLSANDIHQMVADKIVKAKELKAKEAKAHQAKFSSNTSVDVIPGTNIPRPVLNIKIASRSITGTRSRNNSSLKNNKKAEIPQLSVLDLKWIQYIKHSDERIMKVGIVEALRDVTNNFEKKYKGMIIESPLGYNNKDDNTESNLFSSNDDESIMLLDLASNSVGQNEGSAGTSTTFNTDSTEVEAGSESSVDKFRKFFTVKQPTLPMFGNKYVTRTMIITTFGRALLFKENYGVENNNSKYELTTEIDLTNSLVKFVEVVGDRKISGKNGKGLFAIVSQSITILLEVDRLEISQWTTTLANSRIMEKERRLKESINLRNDSMFIEAGGEAAAHTAATLAAIKNPDLGMTSHTEFGSSSSMAKKPSQSSSTSSSNINNNSRSSAKSNASPRETKKKTSIGKGPMISAAINKAVSMASVNAAVGAKNDDNKKITQMNSKFLARSRLR